MSRGAEARRGRGGKRIRRGMVLAAGLGLRMRPITDRLPKPLVAVGGEPMIDRVLAHYSRAGIAEAVVNTHHLGGMIERHLNGHAAVPVVFSPEDTLLETGGGVRNALPKLGDEPFFVANSDAVWLDGPTPALGRLSGFWDARRMDALLLVFPAAQAFGYEGAGDYFLDPTGRLRRRREREVAPFVFTGVQILHPRLFEDAPDGPFSLNRLYDAAEQAGRLYGIRHDGAWFHVGTPESLDLVNQEIIRPGRKAYP